MLLSLRLQRACRFLIVLASILGTVLLIPGAANADERHRQNWPQWRGPNRDSILGDGPPWPSSFESLQKKWHVPLGPGYSGPIVWGERVFVTETVNKELEVVRALDLRSGKEIWRAQWPGSMSVPFFAKSNGDWIRSTPACDGESLYVAGMRDVLVCLNCETGKVRWRLAFPKKYDTPNPSFGFVASPLLHDNHVYVQAGGGLAKIEKLTGAVVWRILDDGGGMNSAFSSPVVARIGNVEQILVQTRQELLGVLPDSGKVLWRQTVPSFRGMNILTPTVYNDGVFTSTYKNRTFFYQVENTGDQFKCQEAWTAKAQGYMSSPVIIGDHAYLHLGNGRLSCFDLRTGEEKWRSKPFGKYWSMVAHKGRIVALDERGELMLIDANPQNFTLLDRRTVSEGESWAHIAVCGSSLLVRDLSGISLFDWSQNTSKQN